MYVHARNCQILFKVQYAPIVSTYTLMMTKETILLQMSFYFLTVSYCTFSQIFHGCKCLPVFESSRDLSWASAGCCVGLRRQDEVSLLFVLPSSSSSSSSYVPPPLSERRRGEGRGLRGVVLCTASS